jgi:hypothetical protein
MLDKLAVSFDDPEHGWIGLTMIASYTPRESFLDLTNALHNLLLDETEAIVVLQEEPVETELRFVRSSASIKLVVYKYADHRRRFAKAKTVLEVSGDFRSICLPFWRALRNLQGRFTEKELSSRWQRPFPWKEMDLLTAALKQRKSKGY